MDAGVGILLGDEGEQFLLGGGGRKTVVVRKNPRLMAGTLLCGDVGLAGGILTYQNDGQPGSDATLRTEPPRLLQKFLPDVGGDLLAVYYSCAHVSTMS